MADPLLAPAEVFCRSTLNFASRSGEFVAEPTEVEILDGRTADLPGWPECGFELAAHTSAASDWGDDDELVAVHHREMEELAREMTGCDVALVSNHIKRGPEAREAPRGPGADRVRALRLRCRVRHAGSPVVRAAGP